jgi:hypothetical protein
MQFIANKKWVVSFFAYENGSRVLVKDIASEPHFISGWRHAGDKYCETLDARIKKQR